MRALVLNSFDGPTATTIADVAQPALQPGQVSVDVEAAGIGAWDLQTTYGAFTGMGGRADFPQVLGWDFTGTISAIGVGVADWSVGEPVLGFSAQPWTGSGVFAEQVAVDAATLSRRPAGLDVAAAAALPVSGLTADLAVSTAAITAADTVLVLGAAGGVGSLVVQLAHALGARVVASVSLAQADAVRGLGADEVVDRSGDVVAQVLALGGPADVLIDLVGPAAWTPALDALRVGGRFVTAVPLGMPDAARGYTTHTIGVQPDTGRLAELASQLATGQLTIAVADTIGLSDAGSVLVRLEQGRTNGKLVIDPRR